MRTTLIEVGDVTAWQDSTGEPHHTRTRRINCMHADRGLNRQPLVGTAMPKLLEL